MNKKLLSLGLLNLYLGMLTEQPLIRLNSGKQEYR